MVTLVPVAIHILACFLISSLVEHGAVFLLAVVVPHPVLGAIATAYEMSQILIPAEAVLLKGTRVDPLQHVLLQVDAGDAEVGGAEVAVEVVCFVLVKNDLFGGVQSHLLKGQVIPVRFVLVLPFEQLRPYQMAVELVVLPRAGLFTKGQSMGDLGVAEPTALIVGKGQSRVFKVPEAEATFIPQEIASRTR